ncbi:MAG: molybdopterin-guanine dinucleotide biosynthesis protein B [Methylophilaceae bacterium]|nr:molybdopterin-guanine dinucleotide biosynthesis protein B [Methylophilaceae bacterium]
MNCPVPLLGFCAWGSGIGKTTLLTQLIPVLVLHGVRLSVIKHAHHTFDIDHPGKDSYRLREAGAVQMLLGSKNRWALVTERWRTDAGAREIGLDDLLPHIDTTLVDLILVEGFKREPIPKIEVYRPALAHPLLADSDPNVIAIATDGAVQSRLPVLDLNDSIAIADFVLDWLRRQQPAVRLKGVI